MSVISLWMANNLNHAEPLIQTMIRERPQIVMCQDVPYLTDEELEALFLDRMDIDYTIHRKHAGELNRVGNHIADNFMLIQSSIKVAPIYDDSAREWMQESSVNIFGVMLELGEPEPPGTYITLEDAYKVPVFSVLAHEPLTELDALQNVYWMQKMLNRDGLDPNDMIVMGHFHDDSLPRMMERVLGVTSLGQTTFARTNSSYHASGSGL